MKLTQLKKDVIASNGKKLKVMLNGSEDLYMTPDGQLLPMSLHPITPANLKPVVITGSGKYLTRDNRIVLIDQVLDHSDNYAVTRMNCKGILFTPSKKGTKVREDFGIWHQSGCFGRNIGGTNPEDIINKLL